MSTSNRTNDLSASNFASIFDAASQEYKILTKHDLWTHPFAAALEGHNTSDSILRIFQKQAQAFDKISQGDDKLMGYLTPIVNILFAFSGTLAVALPFSPVTPIFTGIGVLLGAVKDVIASYETVLEHFERIHFFLQRLDEYSTMPLTPAMTELLGKILAQVLLVLALSTKAMKKRRTKTFLKRLAGKTDLDDAFARLDVLTKEENLAIAARTLKTALHVERMPTGNQLRESLRDWLTPPDPSTNHNIASKALHAVEGTTRWFIRDSRFDEWKKSGSLLWILGNPGTGKTILCSAIIEDIKCMTKSMPASAMIAYYYFDYKDDAKHDLRGLLVSLLWQLAGDSDLCWDTLYQLYETSRSGVVRPSDHELIECFKAVLDLPGQVPVYIIVDALDECPNDTGIPSARDEVLKFVQDVVRSHFPKLFICVISRPEQDIASFLKPLTLPSRRVTIHEEDGQREDINTYIRFVVQNDHAMRRWRKEDKDLVINTLSERAAGMFRWVYCQLNTLRRSLPSSIRKSLDELPRTLFQIYERILRSIPTERQQHASRLLHCMVAALRPLRVEELAEIFAIEFGTNTTPHLVEEWRPDEPEEAVLSTCSTLISVIDDKGSKIVQFSHFTVKEFLISDHLRELHPGRGSLHHYHVPLKPAHTTFARACLAILLQMDKNVNKKQLAAFPLAFYAAQNWVDHVRVEEVESQIEDSMEALFDPKGPYFRTWIWLHDMDRGRERSINILDEHPPPPKATPLYYAVCCGFTGLAKRLIVSHAEDVNAKCGRYGTPLHAASSRGHVDAARVLLDYGADGNARNQYDESPLYVAYYARQLKIMELLLERGVNIETSSHFFPVSIFEDASADGQEQVVQLLLKYGAGG